MEKGNRLIYLVSKIFFEKVATKARGMSLWPIVLFKEKELAQNQRFIQHEQIHLRQQLELLVIPFYVLYLTEYVFYRLKGKNHQTAYMSISFEREAYAFEDRPTYLENRRPFAMYRN